MAHPSRGPTIRHGAGPGIPVGNPALVGGLQEVDIRGGMHVFDERTIQVAWLSDVCKTASSQLGIDNVGSSWAFPALDQFTLVEFEGMMPVMGRGGVDPHSCSCGWRQIVS
jgi:hypothetical protein